MGFREIAFRSRSEFVATIIVFAALTTALDSIPSPITAGVWSGLVFMISPLTGVILGPRAGFLTILMAVMVGHWVYFRDIYEFVFTFGAPIGAMISGFSFRGKHRTVWIFYTFMLMAYFLSPISRQLPLIGMWDCYLAYAVACILPLLPQRILAKWNRALPIALASLLGLEADVLFRIFVLVPCGTYRLFYGFTPEVMTLIWYAGAAITPAKVALSTIATTLVGNGVTKVLELRSARRFS